MSWLTNLFGLGEVKASTGASTSGTTQLFLPSQQNRVVNESQTPDRQNPYINLDQAIKRAVVNPINPALAVTNDYLKGGFRDDLMKYYKTTLKDLIVLRNINMLWDAITNNGYTITHRDSGNSLPNAIRDNIRYGGWFNKVLRGIFDAEYYGISLLRLQSQPSGLIFGAVELERARVNTIARRFYLTEIAQPNAKYVNYASSTNRTEYLEIAQDGNPNSVGYLDPISRKVIIKNIQLRTWSANNEENTVVVRVFTGGKGFDRTSEDQVNTLVSTLQNASKTKVQILNEDEKIENLHSQTSFNHQAIRNLIDDLNEEITGFMLSQQLNTEIADGVQASLANKASLNAKATTSQNIIEDYVNQVLIPRLAERRVYASIRNFRFSFNSIPTEYQMPVSARGGSSTDTPATQGQGSGSSS